jgi:hypothetical protein
MVMCAVRRLMNLLRQRKIVAPIRMTKRTIVPAGAKLAEPAVPLPTLTGAFTESRPKGAALRSTSRALWRL